MKPFFGAKPAKSCLPSTHWIAVNHKTEDAVSMPVAGKTYRPMDGTNTELAGQPVYAINAELGRDGRAIGINCGRRKLGSFRQAGYSAPIRG
jgi:hypothetical protein